MVTHLRGAGGNTAEIFLANVILPRDNIFLPSG